MSILTELNNLLAPVLQIETGVFSGKAPDEYIVITPMADTFELHADNKPGVDVQEARLSLYSKGNYISRKNQIVRALIDADFTITARQFVGREDDSGYFHQAIDVAKHYELEE